MAPEIYSSSNNQNNNSGNQNSVASGHQTQQNSNPQTNYNPEPQAHHPGGSSHKSREKHHHKRKRNVDDYSSVMRHEKPRNDSTVPYVPKPKRLSFENQLNEEEVLLMLRRHPASELKNILILFFGLLVPIVIPITKILSFLPPRFELGFFVGWYVIWFGLALQSLIVWFFSVNIITDERIVDVDFIGLTYKSISTAKLDQIEDVTSTTAGFMGSILDYGTVDIQTAAEKAQFKFELVPHPNRVATLLNELLLEEEREKIEGRVM